ncbi:MAG: methenyltetrahydromethanopterin cyclohydrolase [Planctomycetes bacterium]|nr:methenyltetrahydromethanopterin cyclohydrolase [Planctomycetota bacterium]
MNLNIATQPLVQLAEHELRSLRIECHCLEEGGRILDFGCRTYGGIEAGLLLAKICLGNRAAVELAPADRGIWPSPLVMVSTDDPCNACMGSQYAGWKLAIDSFFAMGSGPMRAKRGNEAVLDALAIQDESNCAIGVLECEDLPPPSVLHSVADACRVRLDQVTLCVAPTRSVAGVIQVVARSVETSMHKLFELGFDLKSIVSGHGTAPMPPIAVDFVKGIGRTNDAILYGGHVTLWVSCDDSSIQEVGPKVPSATSSDYGQPFAKTFKAYDYDFYKVDPGLFAPAMVTFVNLKSGRSFRYGKFNPEVLQESFGELAGP